MLLACCHCVFALNPSLDINQYAHNAWKISEGFFKGSIRSLAQTPDGYLWVGTEFGLVRFDGVRSVPWQPPPREQLRNTDIRSLCAARDGSLWIGTFDGLASWKDDTLTHYRELDGQVIEGLLEDREGTIWVAGWAPSSGRLCSIRRGQTQCYGEDGRFGSGVTPLYEDRQGDLWAGAVNGLWRWKPGPPRLYPMPDPANRIYALAESEDGGILIAKLSGITRFRDGKTEPYPIPAGLSHKPYRLLKDRDGGLWIGDVVDRGLVHIHQGRTDFFNRPDGLSGSSVSSLLQDREGNVWVGTTDGLDRFRDFAIPTISVPQGLSSRGVFSILAAKNGSLWLGMSDGLNRWDRGRITVYHKRPMHNSPDGFPAPVPASVSQPVREIVDGRLPDIAFQCLFEDDRGRIWVGTSARIGFLQSDRFVPVPSVPPGVVYSMAEDLAGDIWISHQAAIFRLSHETVVKRIPWAALGRSQPAEALVYDPAQDGLWLGFRDGGVAYFKDGRLLASYGPAEGLGEGMVSGFYVDHEKTLWATTGGGLSRIRDGRVLTLSTQNGLPCDTVHWMIEDDAGSVWLYLACGLARIPRAELDAWVLQPKRTIQATIFDNSDGVSTHRFTGGYNAVVAKAADGKLWFLRVGGVGIIDPSHLAPNPLQPPVHIESLNVNGKPYEPRGGMSLPPHVHDFSIDYTALSLVAPEKVRFKYRLEGQDADWKQVVNERHAQYTNLSPKKYVFRVTASNNSGVWNETGDTLEFSIAPAYYQTDWFRALVAALVLAFMGAAYRLRLWQVQQESRRLRDVIETIPEYVWSALPDGLVDFVNRRWLEFSGLSLDQARGWGWAAAVHPEDRGRLLDAFRSAIASGKALEEEARMHGVDGRYRWLLFRSVPQRDRSGKIVKWYGKSTDIEDRKRAEETLRETETRFRTYIDHATDAFFVLDFEGGAILDVNRRACENLGYTREELVGKTVFEFEAGLDPEWLERNIRPRLEAGESVTFETRHRRKDGSVFPVEIRARAFQTGGRTVNLSLVQDITERKRAEDERERLRQMEADLAHINRVSMMGELAASVAHEVNQPLAGIVSNGSAGLRFLNADTPDVEEAREAFRDIVRDGKRAGEIIRRIRALTKRTELPREKLDLNEIILEVLALVGDEAKKNTVVIRTQFEDEVSAVDGDRVQLQQVLLNLLINAIQAMSGVTDRERRVAIITQNTDQYQVQVTVEDSGTGLDPDKLNKMFDAFYTTKSGGMGMGLSICRSILQNHGGRLWATANDGPGASFHFTIPRYQAKATEGAGAAG